MADLWFRTPNQNLKGMRPKDFLIDRNNHKPVEVLIDSAIDGEAP